MNKKTALALLLITIALTTSIVTYFFWIRGADHRDFYPWWASARRVLSGERDIYSINATQELQLAIYGRLIPRGQDQQGFAYPATLLPILIPFALIPDAEIATAVWNGFSVSLMVAGLLLLRPQGNEPSKLIIALSLLWLFTLLMIFQGQITGFLIAIFCIGYWSLKTDQLFLGGLVASLAFVKPELALLPIGTLLALSLLQRKSQFVFGFLLGSLTLLGISIALIGFWFGDWFSTLGRYSQYAQVNWPIARLLTESPLLGIGGLVGVALAISLLRKDEESLFCLSIPLAFLLLPQTLIWGLSALVVPLNIAWYRARAKIPIVLVWLAGWLSLAGNIIDSNWWRVQVIIFPVAVLAIVLFTQTKATPSKPERANPVVL